MHALSRTTVAHKITAALLQGHSFTPEQLNRYLEKTGGHELSRVLTMIRNEIGVPVIKNRKGAYALSESDRAAYLLHRENQLKAWKKAAARRRTARKLRTTSEILRGIVGKVSRDSLREVIQAIQNEYR